MKDKATPPRRRWRRASAIALAALFLLVVAAGAAVVGLAARGLDFPHWLVARIEARVNDRLAGASLEFGGIGLTIPRGDRPALSLHDVTVRDAEGTPLAVLDRLGAKLDGRALLHGDLAPRRLRLDGARVTLRRDGDGGLLLSLGGGGMAFPGVSGLLDGVEAVFARPALAEMDTVDMTDLSVTVEDARTERVWRITGGRLRLSQSDDAIDATLAADIENGSDAPASAQVSLRSIKGDGRATMTARLTDAPAPDLALQTPALAFLGVLDAPISGALRGALDEDGRPESVAGTLEIGAGEIRPNAATDPLAFDSARLYFDFDPDRARLDISRLAAETETASVEASGHAYLRDTGPNGWPRALVTQIAVSRLDLRRPGVLAEPLSFSSGTLDARLGLAPFRLKVGQLSLGETLDEALHASGELTATPEGWRVAVDLRTAAISVADALTLWPVPLAPGTRRWLQENVAAGRLTDVTGALRRAPGEEPRLGASYGFEGAEMTALDTMPPITGASGFASLVDDRFAARLEQGQIAPDQGGALSLAGTTFVVEDTKRKPARGHFGLSVDGRLTGILSLLTRPPINLFSDSERGPADIAEAAAHASVEVGVFLGPKGTDRQLEWSAEGTLSGLSSETLLKGRRLTANAISVSATDEAVVASGSARLDGVPVTARWRKPLRPDTGSELRGQVTLSPEALDAFGIALPPGSVAGEGSADIVLDLPPDGGAPRLKLRSPLQGIRLSLGALGWSKPPGTAADLQLTAQLGAAPSVDSISLAAPGLDVAGAISLDGGQLDAARFDRVRVGGWLDAPVTLTGRGEGRSPAISVRGGTLDLRKSEFGGGESGGGGGSGGERGPVDVALDRLVVSEGIALEGVRGTLAAGAAVSGTFTGRVNGGPPVTAELSGGGRGVSVRIRASDAGGVAAAAGFLKQGRGGDMEIVLKPTGEEGTYEGSARITDTRIVGAPTLAELLSAISVVGLIEQMQGRGLVFDDVQARFRLSPHQLTLYKSSAVGASLGLSMDGVFNLDNRIMDMQGVVSPIYMLNGIGQIFTRKGEGLFGFNFRLTGPAKDPSVQVNPLSILTPGMFREIFRRPPPEPPG